MMWQPSNVSANHWCSFAVRTPLRCTPKRPSAHPLHPARCVRRQLFGILRTYVASSKSRVGVVLRLRACRICRTETPPFACLGAGLVPPLLTRHADAFPCPHACTQAGSMETGSRAISSSRWDLDWLGAVG
eukprot:1158346-Pelagomonas_calceolata.AAC.3